MPRRTLRVRLHRKDASGPPLGTALRACRRHALRRFVPSHIHMELVMDKIDLASYALTAGRTFGSPESVQLARGREPRAFACPIGINAGMQFITKSVRRAVQILDLYPRLVSITLIDFDKKSEIFCPL